MEMLRVFSISLIIFLIGVIVSNPSVTFAILGGIAKGIAKGLGSSVDNMGSGLGRGMGSSVDDLGSGLGRGMGSSVDNVGSHLDGRLIPSETGVKASHNPIADASSNTLASFAYAGERDVPSEVSGELSSGVAKRIRPVSALDESPGYVSQSPESVSSLIKKRFSSADGDGTDLNIRNKIAKINVANMNPDYSESMNLYKTEKINFDSLTNFARSFADFILVMLYRDNSIAIS